MSEEISKTYEEFKVLREKIKKDFSLIFYNLINEKVFKVNPEVSAIYFEMYTPYFNDGEPCVNSIGEVFLITNLSDKELETCEHYDFKDDDKDVINDYDKTYDLRNIIDELEDFLLSVYGTNHSFIITKSGKISVEDFDVGF